jgi:hypothetical protein
MIDSEVAGEMFRKDQRGMDCVHWTISWERADAQHRNYEFEEAALVTSLLALAPPSESVCKARCHQQSLGISNEAWDLVDGVRTMMVEDDGVGDVAIVCNVVLTSEFKESKILTTGVNRVKSFRESI